MVVKNVLTDGKGATSLCTAFIFIYVKKKILLHLTLIQTALLPAAVFHEQKYFRVYRKIPTPSGPIR